MASKRNIEEILNVFEKTFQFEKGNRPFSRVGCQLCRHERQREINREILSGHLDVDVGKRFGYQREIINYHRLNCIPKFGCIELNEAERLDARRANSLPKHGKAIAKQKWYLQELLFLRDEAMRATKVNRAELLRLAKEIQRADEKLEAMEEQHVLQRKAKKSAPEPQPAEDEDFTPEQLKEMSRVGKTNGGTHERGEKGTDGR